MTNKPLLNARKRAPLAFGLISLACVPLNGIAATFTPTDELTLRAGLTTAQGNGESDTIDLGGAEITLNSGPLIYVGTGESTLTIQNGSLRAESDSNILQIRGSSASGEAVAISNVTFSGGSNTTEFGTGQGGAIDSRLPLTITSSTFSSNTADLSGGAIYGTASIRIANSYFTGNVSSDAGGAVTGLGDVSIGDSLFSGNTGDRGGSVFTTGVSSSLSVTGSTFDGNRTVAGEGRTALGGAIFSTGSSSVSISTSTFNENDAGNGGGALYFQSLPEMADISRVTLWNNSGGGENGSAIRIFDTNVNLTNTFVGSNLDGNSLNCQLQSNAVISSIGSLSTDGSCGSTDTTLPEVFASFFGSIGDATNDDLTVGSNGTQSLPVLIPAEGGPLDDASGDVCVGIDQRGNAVSDGMCDIGSVELLLFEQDTDTDGVNDEQDNCPLIANSDQDNLDGDQLGDVCDDDIDGDDRSNDVDAFPRDANEYVDTDGDGTGNNADTDDDGDGQTDLHEAECGSDPLDGVSTSPDADNDGIPDCVETDDDGDGQTDVDEMACGSDPLDAGSTSSDADNDGIPDCVDNDFVVDTDGDGVGDNVDNCPLIANEFQENLDGDFLGDVCDDDIDGDGVPNADDAFPTDRNESVDTDGDGTGNNGDTDDDGDGQTDLHEAECGSDPLDAGSTSSDADNDGIPDCVDNDFVVDTDGDGVGDNVDNCPLIANGFQENLDGDFLGDVCDDDIDGDGVLNELDAFPLDPNESVDTDNDGVGDQTDNCLVDANPGQEDANGDGIGDACEVQIDPQPVTVYQHINFNGNALSVGEGDLSFGELRASSVGNDRISSIDIAPGYEVYACRHGGFRGRCETFTGSVSDLRDISFNDVISSLRVSKATPPVPVTVYEHVNFRGNSLSVGEGELSFAELRDSIVGNDRISSIDIAPGYEVYACRHGGFRGRCETFTGSVSDLRDISFNDVISSLRVQQQ